MKYISEISDQNSFTNILELVKNEPIIICQNNQEVAIMMSIKDYEYLGQNQIKQFNEFCDEIGTKAMSKGLTEEKLAEILADE